FKKTRPRKLFGLQLHFEQWRKSKDGYRWLAQERLDPMLSEPNREMANQLKQYFHLATKNRPCLDEQSFIFDGSTDQVECAQSISGGIKRRHANSIPVTKRFLFVPNRRFP